VSPLYLYAVLGAAPAAPLGEGLAGEPLRTIDCGAMVAAVGLIAESPPVSPESLRGHDAVVRRLTGTVDALLPARFGTLAPDARGLCERLERAAVDLQEALVRVAGREQMILRVFTDGPGAAPPPAMDGSDAGGPGTRYLAERARAQRAATAIGELAPLRPVLDRFVTAERVERHDALPLVASVYHLVPRGAAAEYATAVEDAARRLSGMRVTVSGPWAAYAFAPETLG
jgi:Gas vesicle synthesis protein GvpL/GvpF